MIEFDEWCNLKYQQNPDLIKKFADRDDVVGAIARLVLSRVQCGFRTRQMRF
jgi:hypothetical protein